jgi:hypothetical protein
MHVKHERGGRFRPADHYLEAMQRAAARPAANPYACFHLAVALARLGRLPEAIDQLREQLRRNPGWRDGSPDPMLSHCLALALWFARAGGDTAGEEAVRGMLDREMAAIGRWYRRRTKVPPWQRTDFQPAPFVAQVLDYLDNATPAATAA